MSMRKTLVAAAFAVSTVVGTAGTAFASGSDAVGSASDSPGLLSGNVIQVPVNIPIDLCGDTIDIIGLLNPATGSVCVNR